MGDSLDDLRVALGGVRVGGYQKKDGTHVKGYWRDPGEMPTDIIAAELDKLHPIKHITRRKALFTELKKRNVAYTKWEK